MQGILLVVSSFPRSGTHFLIDLLRLNFRELQCRLPFWSSAEDLYFNLDRFVLASPAWSTKSLDRENVIVKTHRLPFEPVLQEKLQEIAAGRRIVVVTPVRRLPSQLASYHRYAASTLAADEFLNSEDPFYLGGMSVAQAAVTFFSYAREHSHLIDVEKGRDNPQALLDHLGQVLGLERNNTQPVLPSRRQTHGLFGELSARFSGRQSSEVIVRVPSGNKGLTRVELNDELRQLDDQLQRLASF